MNERNLNEEKLLMSKEKLVDISKATSSVPHLAENAPSQTIPVAEPFLTASQEEYVLNELSVECSSTQLYFSR